VPKPKKHDFDRKLMHVIPSPKGEPIGISDEGRIDTDLRR
jgi:hypothetical protein